MDKEEARFILRCFRPDGSDASDPEFAEALHLAAADRELGEWLAKERSQDAEFSRLLGEMPLPGDLREEILAGLALERGDLPEADEIDASLIGALAMVRPPEALRDEIIAAMERSAPSAEPKRSPSWWRYGVPLAAAAGIALAFVIKAGPEAGGSAPGISGNPGLGAAVPVSFVQSQAIATLESPDFSFNLATSDHDKLFEFIRSEGRSCPSGALPEGLEAIPSLGCRVIEVDGKPGAIVCFRRDKDQVVHLVVFRRNDIEGRLPDGAHPQFEQREDWSMATWEDRDRVFVMLGQNVASDLEELF